MHMKSKLFQNLTAALVLVFILGLCFQALVLNPSDVLVGSQDQGHNDTTNQFIAFKNYQRICLEQHSELPFWNPYSLLGMPWLGSPQSSLFYPGNWIFYFTNAISTISWSLLFHHWWAGFGAYLLGRKYGLNFFSSLISGILFLAAPYFVAKTGEGHFTSITQIAWFPWIFYCYELLIEGRKKAIPLMAMLIAFAFFCGHVQELYYLLLFFTFSVAVEALIAFFRKKTPVEADTAINDQIVSAPSKNRVNTSGLIKAWIIAGILTMGLVAVDLIPVFIYTQQAVRASGIDLTALESGSLAIPSLLQLLDPFVWGGPANYRGPGGYYWEAVCFFGCLPLLLAFVGILTSFKKRTVIRLSLFGFASFLLAFGPHLPFYKFCYDVILGFSMFRIPARLLWICSLAIAMLAGFGCESLSNLFLNPLRKKYRQISIACFITAFLLLLWLVFESPGRVSIKIDPERIIKIQLIPCLIAILGLCASVFLSSISRKMAIGGITLLGVICTLELSEHSNQILRTIPQSTFRSETKITQFLKENLGGHRVLVGQKLLSDREAWNHQILKIQGYEPVPLVRLGLLAAATFPQKDAALMMAGYSEPQLKTARQPLLDLLSVKYAVLQTDKRVEIEGWKIVDQGVIPEEFMLRNTKSKQIPYLILENEKALPRAYLVGKTKPLNQNEQSQRIVKTIEKVQPRNEVFLQQDDLPKGKRQTYKAAEIVQATPNKLLIKAELDAPGFLILSDIYYPGWTARVNESLIPILPANFSLRAIPLPAGKHDVHLAFMPPGFKIGRIISIMTLAIILILLLKPLRTAKDLNT